METKLGFKTVVTGHKIVEFTPEYLKQQKEEQAKKEEQDKKEKVK